MAREKWRCTVGEVYQGDARHVPNLRGGPTRRRFRPRWRWQPASWVKGNDTPPTCIDVQEWPMRNGLSGPVVLRLHWRANDARFVEEIPGELGGRRLL